MVRMRSRRRDAREPPTEAEAGQRGPEPVKRLRTDPWRAVLEVAVPVALLALAAAARLTGLGHPPMLVFDESYYVKDAWSVWRLGYEGEWGDDANQRFEAGDQGALTDEPAFVVHPPLGKWIIGMAMAMFGIADPFWWRLPTALAGIALVGLTYAVARGLLGSIAFSALAGFWMAIDGFAIVMSRTALLDGILAMFVLAAGAALLLDRRGSPSRTVRAIARQRARFGGAMWRRPWLIAAGALLGAACATKWSGLAYLAAFGLWSVLLDALDRRRAGWRHPWSGTLLTQAPASFVLLVGTALVIYVASYARWFGGGWGSMRMADSPSLRWDGPLEWVPLGLQSLWQYHADQLVFHGAYAKDHPYASSAGAWPWLENPMAFVTGGDWAIYAWPNPLVWFASIAAMAVLAYAILRRFDRASMFVLIGIAAGYVPWFFVGDRTIYFFYVIVLLPFMMIGLARALQVVAVGLGSGLVSRARAVHDRPSRLRRRGRARQVMYAAALAILVAVSVRLALVMMPLWYGIPSP